MTGEPGPSERAGEGDDGQIVVERLDGEQRPSSPTRARAVWRGAALLALLALLAAGGVALWPLVPKPRQSVAALRFATPTVVIPAGWVRDGPSDASYIAFAASVPARAYACGPDASPSESGTPEPIHLYDSGDNGHTWGTLDARRVDVPGHSGFTGVFCALSVDPVDANDLVLFDEGTLCATGADAALYRSHDGGETWRQITLPAWDASGQLAQPSFWMAWAGATLFVEAAAPCGGFVNRLAASVNGAPFAWADGTLFASAPSDATLGGLTSTGTSLYVQLISKANCPPICSTVRRTSDNGASWSFFTPTWHSQSILPLIEPENGGAGALFAQIYPDNQNQCAVARTYLRSTDDGATWGALPSFGTGLIFFDQVLAAPDGTVYARVEDPCNSVPQTGIYKLRPGATTWVLAATETRGGFVTLTWDQAGEPEGLWGTNFPDAHGPFLMYHQP